MQMSKPLRIAAKALFILATLGAIAPLSAQLPDNGAVVRGIDASVKGRIDNLVSYTASEHYAVFRSHDETHPAAEMIIKTVYRRGIGKSYSVLSESGSSFLRTEVLESLLNNEKRMSEPGNVETALLNSANYDIRLLPNAKQQLSGRDCLAVSITPRRTSPFLFKGTLWVDAKDYSIVQLEGTASKSAFFLASAAAVSRQYINVDGFPMAIHARAVSNSAFLGQTIVKIDYTDYQIDPSQGTPKSMSDTRP
jgi:hypothetical protein